MGSAASKKQRPPSSKGSGSTQVVAEVKVPGQSQPVKVKGHMKAGIDSSTATGPAKLTEVTPSKYTVQMGDQDIGTFDVPSSDFGHYLKQAASLTVTNIETVGGDDEVDFPSGNQPLHIPLTRQSSSINGVVYSDDEDWENVAESLEKSDSKTSSAKMKEDAKERRAKIKQAISEKRQKLSQKDYEQMIANHKQEMELMAILREREKERNQLKLGSKVAERKRKRAAKLAEKKEREALLAEKEESSEESEVSEPGMKISKETETDPDTAAVKQEMERKKSAFQTEVEDRKENFSKEEYQRLLEQHEAEMAALDQRLNHQLGRQRQSFLQKQAARKRRRAEKVLTATELQELEAELQEKQRQFETELKEKKKQVSDGEYKRLLAEHKMELNEMQEKLELQRQRQRQDMLDKLASRKKMRNKSEEKGSSAVETLSADEVKELQIALNHRAMAFKDELKEAKTKMSAEKCQEMINRHRSEMDEIQAQLDEERERMRQKLMEKLKARERKSKEKVSKEGEKCLSPEELKQLQLMIDNKNTIEKQRLASQRNKLSSKEYQRLLDQHHQEVLQLERRLEYEKQLSLSKLKNKMAARRIQRPKSGTAGQAEGGGYGDASSSSSVDLQTLEQEIETKEAAFQANVEKKRAQMTNDQYRHLLRQHQEEMDSLRNKLSMSKERQRQHLQDKLTERRRKKGVLTEEEEEVYQSTLTTEQLEQEIQAKEAAFKANVEERRSHLSDDEYRSLLEQHKHEMESLRNKLEQSRDRQRQHFHDKLAERRRRRGMRSEEDEKQELLELLENGANSLKEEDVKEIEIEVREYDNTVRMGIQKKKGQVSKAEMDRLLAEHSRNMEDFNERLRRQRQRMLERLEEKKAARRMKIESEADFVHVMTMLGKNQEENSETLTEEELNDLQQDLKKYSETVFDSLEEKRGIFPNEELNLMISEHHRNMEAMESMLEKERMRMEQKMRAKMAMRQTRTESSYTEESEEVRVAHLYHQDGFSSSDEDDDNDDDDDDHEFEIEDNPELLNTMAQLSATQFWTTPVQSADVLIVPLVEEYPVKKKKELYTDPSIFRELDAHAIRLAQTVSLVTQPTFSSLVSELTSIATTELEKARVVFRWITAQNCDEMNLSDVVDDTPLGVLKGLYQKKITFSTLFMRMCRYVGLQCVEITGIAKMKGYTPGWEINPKDPSYHHTWNAVRIDGYWHFLDCNWGVSHILGSVTFDPFRFEYDEHYFLADPEVIISSHFPNDSSWQLLREQVSLEVFNRALLLKPDFFKYGFGLLSHKDAVLSAHTGELDIRIICPTGFLLSCRLSDAESGSEKTRDGLLFDQFEFIHQTEDNIMACYVRIPETGTFHLTLFVKRQFFEGELNIESPTEICRYLVHCLVPSSDRVPLPLSPADHWGPVGVMNAGLVPLSHRTGVIFSQEGRDVEVMFRQMQNLRFSQTLTAWGRDENQLRAHVIQRSVDDQLIFTVSFPQPDRYGLHIFVSYPGHPNPIHLCSYLIVANVTKPDIRPFPLLRESECWGPSAAFQSLNLFQKTHPDPYIITEESILMIEVGHGQKCEVMCRLYGTRAELSGGAQMHSSSDQSTFAIDLTASGFYVFKIFAKEAGLEGIPFTHVFNYLIQKI